MTGGHPMGRSRQAAPRLRVALLEDSAEEAAAVIDLLDRNDCDVLHRTTAAAFLDLLRADSFDVLILDWNLPDLAGYAVLRKVRDNLRSSVPVLMLTARGGEFEVVQALNGGANDYLVKPWRRFELLARLQAMVRAAVREHGGYTVETIEGWVFDRGRHGVFDGPVFHQLTGKEFEVARLLFLHMGRPLSREHLRASIWIDDVLSRTIDTHVSRVRTKLALTVANGFTLQALYGFGYRLDRADVNEQGDAAEGAL
jgi:DNA-binding response OmpR family regulator